MFRDIFLLIPDRSPKKLFRTTLCFLALCLLGPTSAWSQTNLTEPRPSDYERQFRAFAKNSRAEDLSVQRAAAYNLCQLHAFVVSDSRFSTHEKLKSIRFAIAKRLRQWESEYEIRLKRAARQAKTTFSNRQQPPNDNDPPKFLSVGDPFLKTDRESEVYSPEEIAKFQCPPESDVLAGDVETSSGDREIELVPIFGRTNDELDRQLISSLGQSHALMGDLSGGAGQVYQYAGANLGAPWNHSADLMALIRQVVSPEVWRTAGGNSSMFYFQPAGALVIRASQKTHDNVCDLLWKLRASF